MSGYKRHAPVYLTDAAGTPVGVLDRLGREWLFPAPLVVAPDAGASLAFGQLLHDINDVPIGYDVFGREFIFGSLFTLNTTRGLREARRQLLINAAGAPIGLFGNGAQASRFPILPAEAAEQFAIAAMQRNAGILPYLKPSLSNVFSDSAGTVPAALNGPCGAIRDYSGNVVAYQPTAANKPTIVSGPNGYPVLSFDGAARFMLLSLTAPMSTAHSLIVGGTLTAPSTSSTFATAGGSSTLGPDPTGPQRISQIRLLTGGNVSVLNTNDQVNPVNELPNNTFLDSGRALVMSSIATAANFTVYRLGVSIGTVSQAGGASTLSSGIWGSYSNTGLEPMTGTSGGLALCLSTMPDADRIAIERFIAQIHGATYAL